MARCKYNIKNVEGKDSCVKINPDYPERGWLCSYTTGDDLFFVCNGCSHKEDNIRVSDNVITSGFIKKKDLVGRIGIIVNIINSQNNIKYEVNFNNKKENYFCNSHAIDKINDDYESSRSKQKSDVITNNENMMG